MTEQAVLAEEKLAQSQREYLSQLLEDRKLFTESIKDLEKDKKKIDDEIKALMAEVKHTNIQTEKWSVKLIASVRRSIDGGLLLKNGVKADIIASSMKETEVVSLRVDPVKRENGEGK